MKMNKYISLLIVLVATLLSANALAFTAPPAPANGWYVYDGTGRLTTTQVSDLNHKIKSISDATHNEFGLVFIQSLDGSTIDDAAYETFQKWGIGKHGLDNGVLIILSLKDHKSRIETGKGVGGEITDLQAKQILDSMRPQLQTGNFYGAFNLALDSVSSLLDSRANQKATPIPVPAVSNANVQQPSSGHGELIAFFIMVCFGMIGVIVWIFISTRRTQKEIESRRLERMETYSRRSREQDEYVAPAPTVYTEVPVARPSIPLTVAADVAAAGVAVSVLDTERQDREERRERLERRKREEREESESRRSQESSTTVVSTYDSGPSIGSSVDIGGGTDIGGGFGGGSSGGGGADGSW
jgi:uncharacterized protein